MIVKMMMFWRFSYAFYDEFDPLVRVLNRSESWQHVNDGELQNAQIDWKVMTFLHFVQRLPV